MRQSGARRLAGITILSLLATLAFTTTAQAAPLRWTSPNVLRESRQGLVLEDTDFAGTNVAIVWEERRALPPHATLKTSVDGGLTFSPGVRFARAKSAAVDLCGDQVVLAYTRQTTTGGWELNLVRGSAGSTAVARTLIATSDGELVGPDVACLTDRVFLSWLERDAAGHHLRVAAALMADGKVDRTFDLGFDRGDSARGLQIAAAGDHAYAIYGRHGDPRLLFQSWTVATGPGFPVTSHAERYVAPRSNCPAWEPLIDADGDRVAIAWGRMGVVARVSTDAGKTWGPTIGNDRCPGPGVHVDGGSAPRHISVSGRHIALSYVVWAFGTYDYVMLTQDDFATVADRHLSNGWWQAHYVGFVTLGGRIRVADAVGVWGRWIGYRVEK